MHLGMHIKLLLYVLSDDLCIPQQHSCAFPWSRMNDFMSFPIKPSHHLSWLVQSGIRWKRWFIGSEAMAESRTWLALSLMPQHLLLSQICAVMDVLLMWYPRALRGYGDLGDLLKSCPLSSVLQARILSHTSTWQAPPALQSCFHNIKPLFLIALWVGF